MNVFDFADIKGQSRTKRALEVAAAGSHHVLMIRAPGSGRAMLARRLPGILPPLSETETAATAEIFASAGLAKGDAGNQQRPFRAPHHTISRAGLIGGGQFSRPGEASLAHNGVLFLDDLPEFQRSVLATLRQTMATGEAESYRNGQRLAFPARFLLVAAMNPCPCGYYGEARCRCRAEAVLRYLDRIQAVNCFDIITQVPNLAYRDLRQPIGESSAAIRERICAARIFAAQRQGREAPPADKVSRVARTIADLAGMREIRPEHQAEAQSLASPF